MYSRAQESEIDEAPGAPKRSLEEDSTFLGRLLFLWLNPLINKGYKTRLEPEDAFPVPQKHHHTRTYARFLSAWDNLGRSRKGDSMDPSMRVFRAIVHACWFELVGGNLLVLGSVALELSAPFFVDQIIQYIEDQNESNQHDPGFVEKGVWLLIGFTLTQLLNALVRAHAMYWVKLAGINIWSTIITAVFHKSLRVAGSGEGSGKLVNQMAADSQRFLFIMPPMQNLFLVPIIVTYVMVYLSMLLGVYSLAGLAIMLALMVVNSRLSKRLKALQAHKSEIGDQRVKKMSEIIEGARVMKYNASEMAFMERVQGLRQSEMEATQSFTLIRLLVLALATATPGFTLFAMLALHETCEGHGRALTLNEIFTSVALVSTLQTPLSGIAEGISAIAQARVAIDRLARFLGRPERATVPPTEGTVDGGLDDSPTQATLGDAKSEDGVEMAPVPFAAHLSVKTYSDDLKSPLASVKGSFHFPGDQDQHREPTKAQKQGSRPHKRHRARKGEEVVYSPFTPQMVSSDEEEEDGQSSCESMDDSTPVTASVLHGLDLALGTGELVLVFGLIGAGKSALLHAVLGEMQGGLVRHRRGLSIAYVPQQAFIFNSDVRDNILLLRPEESFGGGAGMGVDESVRASALAVDLENFDDGLATGIGSRGYNLSGGQRQRLSVARALASDCELVVMDDPLSAVDAPVAKHLWSEAIVPIVSQRRRTVLMATQRTDLACSPDVDRIVVLDKGRIVMSGPYHSLKKLYASQYGHSPFSHSTPPSTASSLASTPTAGPALSDVTTLSEETQKLLESILLSANEVDLHSPSGHSLSSQHSSSYSEEDDGSVSTVASIPASDHECEETTERAGRSAAAQPASRVEERHRGAVSLKTYSAYCSAWASPVFLISLFTLFVSAELAGCLQNYWLGLWSNNHFHRGTWFYLGVYGAFACGCLALLSARGFMFSTFLTSTASSMHAGALRGLLRSPMAFFEVTPSGRILNRFSQDVDDVDSLLPFAINLTAILGLRVIGIVVLSCVASPPFTVAVPFIAAAFFYISEHFRRSSREVQRLLAISRSPLFTILEEACTGVVSIRAYKASDRFVAKFDGLMEESTEWAYIKLALDQWLLERLCVISTAVVAGSAIFITFAPVMAQSSVTEQSRALSALSLSYSLILVSVLRFTVRNATDMEAKFNAVDRLLEYSDLEPEAPLAIDDSPGSKDWPKTGAIAFTNVTARYRKELELAIKGISFSIKSGEHIGVVGRSGSGKSTLTNLLFRIVEVEAGTIVIDGVNIRALGLTELRRAVEIVPQDAILFEGTIRYNLDPFDEFDDGDLWSALQKAEMAEFVRLQPLKLSAPIRSSGGNLSMGQRQLMCIARAILRRVKVLILDEATASVDKLMEVKIQDAIKSHFRDATVINIAHRLPGVMWCDRILVMDLGEVVEFDEPSELLSRPNGHFRAMYDAHLSAASSRGSERGSETGESF